jgi:hypothetical protein
LSLGEAGAVVMNDPAFAPGGVLANQGITSINDYFDSANAFPSTVSLYLPNGGGSFCTGSLINSRTILTAAQ